MKKTIAVAFLAMLSVGTSAKSKADTLIVCTTPKMHCQNCENKIKKNIRFVKGTKSITTSLPEQTVTIIYDSNKCRYEDFAAAFKKIGFEIKKKVQ